MLRYFIPCGCGRKTPVSESLAGTYITCECGRSVKVPARSRLYELEPAPPEPAPLPAASKTNRGGETALEAEIIGGIDNACVACGVPLPSTARYCWLCGAKHLAQARARGAKSAAVATGPKAQGEPLTGGQALIVWLLIIVAAIVGYGAVQTQDQWMATLYLIAVVPAPLVVLLGSTTARLSGKPWAPTRP